MWCAAKKIGTWYLVLKACIRLISWVDKWLKNFGHSTLKLLVECISIYTRWNTVQCPVGHLQSYS